MRILIADDDPVSRHLLQNFLNKLGHEVVLADDGAQALRILQQPDAPSLAILDWMMPELDGIQVCQAIRERGGEPYVYLILLTTKAQKKDVVHGLEAGADDYIIKPFHFTELKARLGTGVRILEMQGQLAAARGELQFRALHDSLTGLLNRGAILDALRVELVRARRQKTGVGIFMADLDHFKQINDRHGHLVGDEVLRGVARRMQESVRAYDSVGRYGGEEFLIVLPGSNASGCLHQAERLRVCLSQEPIQTQAGPLSITLSLGMAIADDPDLIEPSVLLGTADAALYRAKENGRNRIELAAPAGFQA